MPVGFETQRGRTTVGNRPQLHSKPDRPPLKWTGQIQNRAGHVSRRFVTTLTDHFRAPNLRP